MDRGFVKLGPASAIEPGKGKAFEIGERVVAVFNLDGDYRAIDDACPHRGASLSRGAVVDECKVICPLHGWEFDIRTGRLWKSEGVATHEVRVVDGEVWVELATARG